jgi:hypothetical protein
MSTIRQITISPEAMLAFLAGKSFKELNIQVASTARIRRSGYHLGTNTFWVEIDCPAFDDLEKRYPQEFRIEIAK